MIRTLPEDASIIFPETDNNIETLFELGCWSNKIGFSSNKDSDNYYIALTEDFSSSQIVSGENVSNFKLANARRTQCDECNECDIGVSAMWGKS